MEEEESQEENNNTNDLFISKESKEKEIEKENVTTISDTNKSKSASINNSINSVPSNTKHHQTNISQVNDGKERSFKGNTKYNSISHSSNRKFSMDSNNIGTHSTNSFSIPTQSRKFSLDSNAKNHIVNDTEDVCTPLQNINDNSNSEKSSDNKVGDNSIFLKDHSVIPLPSYYQRLQNEVQLMMRLDHPNIIKIYQVIESEEETLIVMYVIIFN